MIQCFVKRGRSNSFDQDDRLRLLYVCKTEEEQSILPRAMHSHENRLEMMLITGGEGVYTIRDVRYPVQRGDVLVYNQGVVHDEVSDPDHKMSSYCIGLDGVHVTGVPENCLTLPGDCPLLKAGDSLETVESLFCAIYERLTSGEDGAEEVCHHLTRALVVLLLRLSRSGEDQPVTVSALADRIRSYIDRHYREEISLASISETLNISSYYLAHVFKEKTGYSTVQYIMRRRIGEAQSLLISTQEPVTRVAMLVGYDNPSYFNMIFTKNVGMSPRRYRECYTKKTK